MPKKYDENHYISNNYRNILRRLKLVLTKDI